LKRLRGTPLPTWALLTGKIVHAVLIGFALVIIVALFGWALYGVDLPTRTLPAAMLALAVGSAAFAAIGLAVASVVPNSDAAPAVVNGVMLPLTFISDLFIPMQAAPPWLTTFANVFPLRHLAVATRTAFNPFETGLGFEWMHLLVVAAWGVVAARSAISAGSRSARQAAPERRDQPSRSWSAIMAAKSAARYAIEKKKSGSA
jgi:ABC-type multidrug transport system permease subunit